MANKAFRYRLYPSEEQIILFHKTFGCCRKVWNLMLSDKITSYQNTKHFGSQTPAQYKKVFPYLKEVDSLALSNVQIHLQSALKACFDPKRKKRNHFPKFKSKRRARKTYTTNNQNGTVSIIGNTIRLPKAGLVKAEIHRLPEKNYILKSATISETADGLFYISILFEYENNISPLPLSDNLKALGLDYASDGLYVDDCGRKGANHKYYLLSQKKLRTEQRRLSRRIGSKKNEIPSSNYKKQQAKFAKLHRHIVNQRRDHLQKLSTEIANQYDIVCVEDLDMQAIANRKRHLGKHTYDNGYGMFLNMLSYKMADRGKYLVRVDKWFPSSQLCSCCGTKHPEMKNLKIRVMDCACGNQIDRDQNAAINIKREGLHILYKAV